MSNIIVSIAMKHNVFAIIIMENGMLKTKYTEKIKDSAISESKYLSTIYAFTVALRMVRQYISDNKSSRDVCFEISNSIFIGWIDKMYSKEAYQEQFMSAMALLQELPIRYAFSYSQRPKALPYTDEKYCVKEKLSGLDLLDE